jgi:hypothetical protein
VSAADFDALYESHAGDVMAMAYALTGDLAEAQDLTQEASPQPPPLRAVPPSPRPAPLPPPGPPDDPIARVDWRNATVTLPPHDYCPTGPVRFAPFGGPTGTPRVHADGRVILLNPDDTDLLRPAYGDVTGDGRREVVVAVDCYLSADGTDPPTGHGGHLLVVARADDGTLTGLGWVGPRGADIQEFWVSGGRVLMVGNPWTVNPEEHFPNVPGLALSYRFDGDRFIGWEAAADHPPIVPLDRDGFPPPVRPRAPVATALGCSDSELRFVAEPSGTLWTASASDGTYFIDIRPFQRYLFDLDRTGDRLLVTALGCDGPDGWVREGLAVFERAGGGWQGISVLPPPAGRRWAVAGWTWDGDLLSVHWSDPGAGDDQPPPVAYRWTGTALVPAR